MGSTISIVFDFQGLSHLMNKICCRFINSLFYNFEQTHTPKNTRRHQFYNRKNTKKTHMRELHHSNAFPESSKCPLFNVVCVSSRLRDSINIEIHQHRPLETHHMQRPTRRSLAVCVMRSRGWMMPILVNVEIYYQYTKLQRLIASNRGTSNFLDLFIDLYY